MHQPQLLRCFCKENFFYRLIARNLEMVARCLPSSVVFRSVMARKLEITKGENSTAYRVRMSNYWEKKTISRTGKHRVKLGQDQNSILKLVYTLTLSSRRETKLCILYEVVATKSTKTSCCSHDNINKIFKLQKRCARIILDAQQRHGTVDQVIF